MSIKNSLFTSSFLVLTLTLGGIALPGCGNAENEPDPAQYNPPRPADETKLLPPEAQKALSADIEAQPELIFVFDDKGQLTVFRGEGTNEPTPLELPATINELVGITVVKINPYCWIDTYGRRRCI